MPQLYLGLDSSTQSLSAIAIEVDGQAAHVVYETSIGFDEELPQYGTHHGVLPSADPAVAVSSPLMWTDALDLMFARILASGLDVSRIAAISGSAQQHGSVYVAAGADAGFSTMDPARPPAGQVAPWLTRSVAPIWLDSSTAHECADIAAAVGGNALLATQTGSRAFERFSGPQIRKFAATDPQAYARTARVHLVSSFLASLLIGGDAALDPGDASGMNLMALESRNWWPEVVAATAPDLASKLPRITNSWTVAGTLSPYWQQRHRLPGARIITWSGDNPCSLIGVGLVHEGRVAISLGTSDTIFGLMKEPRVDPHGSGHVFGSPTGDYMGLTCFSNGSLARETIRDAFGLTWLEFSRALESTAPGNDGRILLPWFAPEITPLVSRPGVHRYRLSADDVTANVRAVVEAQQMAMAIHSRWMHVPIDTIHATGGAAVNPQILQVMADVFGADVYRSSVTNSAALGAALRAWHADARASGHPVSWDHVTGAIAQPDRVHVAPNPASHRLYRELIPVYELCEQHALGRGADPVPLLAQFSR